MKGQNNYFSHDGNARNDSKVICLRMRHGAAGYGVYFMILERLREEDGYVSVKDYNMIAFDLRVDASLVKSVVEDFGLFAFTDDGECFYSESFNRRMSVKDEVKKARSEAGKKGGAPVGNSNAQKLKNKQNTPLKQAKTSKCLNENKQKQANGCFKTSKNEVVFASDQEEVPKPADMDENKQNTPLKQAKTSKCLNENKQKQANGCFKTSKESKVKKRKVSNETYNARACEDEEKAKAAKEVKYKYADYVSLTRDEYAKLCVEHGEDPVKAMIDILNNYKGSNGKTYKSDYLAIKNWVINRYYEDIQRYGNKRTDNNARNGMGDNKGSSEATLRTDEGASDVGGAETQKNYAERF